MARITVHTYNILSSRLAPTTHFPQCEPHNLLAEVRLPKILERLGNSIEKGAVICLQEVPMEWTGKFEVFFYKNNYRFISSLYGKPFNGRMGIGMAFPTDSLELEDCDICCVADTKRFPRPLVASPVQHWVKWAVSFLPWSKKESFEQENPWEVSRNRANTMIFCKFALKEDLKIQVCVGTYHMPCAYWCPPVMTIHSSLLAQKMAKLAKSLPFVLAGDFNFKPTDSMYQLYTTGKIDKSDKAYPPFNADANWDFNLNAPLISSYAQILGSEPPFTTYTGGNPSFIDCLDYVFYYPGDYNSMRAETVVPLPTSVELDYPVMPSDQEPSDHLLIGATFVLNAE